ncbi:hypothetical protein TcCL_ESM01608 [Trypanosoma cruzi]|nr:hypothetical protein TcCL_ESM01608 [Trypanosoma cruzi]
MALPAPVAPTVHTPFSTVFDTTLQSYETPTLMKVGKVSLPMCRNIRSAKRSPMPIHWEAAEGAKAKLHKDASKKTMKAPVPPYQALDRQLRERMEKKNMFNSPNRARHSHRPCSFHNPAQIDSRKKAVRTTR